MKELAPFKEFINEGEVVSYPMYNYDYVRSGKITVESRWPVSSDSNTKPSIDARSEVRYY